MSEAWKNWYKANKDRVRAKNRQYYYDHLDKMRAYNKKYREEHKDRIKQLARQDTRRDLTPMERSMREERLMKKMELYGYRAGLIPEPTSKQKEIKKREREAVKAVKIIRAFRYLRGEKEFKKEYKETKLSDKVIIKKYQELRENLGW